MSTEVDSVTRVVPLNHDVLPETVPVLAMEAFPEFSYLSVKDLGILCQSYHIHRDCP